MKYGLYALHRGDNVDPIRLGDCAKRAEDAGFESLWVGDHIALPNNAADSATEPRLEAVTALAFLAAVTTRIRLGIGVLVLPQRQPVLLAKQLTSLDTLSSGRLIVGIGVGYVEPELAAFGVTLADRAAMTDEHLDVMLALWSHTHQFHGRFVSYEGVVQHPGPVQRPHPPIVVGGHTEAALRRAARIGDGWFGWQLGVDETEAIVSRLRAARASAHGSAAAPLDITIAPPEPVTTELAERYERFGVDRLVLVPEIMSATATDALISHVARLVADGDRSA
jgi:probable F420-dependent oxidoreductase